MVNGKKFKGGIISSKEEEGNQLMILCQFPEEIILTTDMRKRNYLTKPGRTMVSVSIGIEAIASMGNFVNFYTKSPLNAFMVKDAIENLIASFSIHICSDPSKMLF